MPLGGTGGGGRCSYLPDPSPSGQGLPRGVGVNTFTGAGCPGSLVSHSGWRVPVGVSCSKACKQEAAPVVQLREVPQLDWKCGAEHRRCPVWPTPLYSP